jgi:hypothetical protein
MSEEEVKDEDILKDPVVAWVVVEAKRHYLLSKGEPPYFVMSFPVVQDCEGWGETTDMDENEKVVGVVPAQPRTYRVSGDIGGCFEELGYEFEGAWHPDWKEALKEKREAADGVAKDAEQDKAKKTKSKAQS